MNDDIEITGCDLRVLVQKAYELSIPQGLGMLHFRPGPLSDEQVNVILNGRSAATYPVSMDYVNGRAVKLSVRKDERGRLWIRSRWLDHSDEQLQQLLDAIGVKAKAAN